MPKRSRQQSRPIDPLDELEKILADADARIRREVQAAGLDAAHVILAAGPAGTGIIRSNARAEVMRELAAMLMDIADQVEAPTADNTKH